MIPFIVGLSLGLLIASDADGAAARTRLRHMGLALAAVAAVLAVVGWALKWAVTA